MPESIKCPCPQCGAKYRLPIETEGRAIRCKRCDHKFRVPKAEHSLEDSVLTWLDDGGSDEEETTTRPRVIRLGDEKPPSNPDDSGAAAKRLRGPLGANGASTPIPGK